ncbi:MAG: ThuA domain-containing protein [Gemmataceae bacterium]
MSCLRLFVACVLAIPVWCFHELSAQGIKLPPGYALEEQPKNANDAKIVLIAGSNYFKPGEHDYIAAGAVLAELLKQTPGVAPVLAVDWPKNPKTLEGARCVVFFFDGGDKHGLLKENRLADIKKLAESGAGLVFFHQTVDVAKDLGERFRELAGGAYEKGYSQRAHWIDTFKNFPDHPVTHGVAPFKIDDGWLYQSRFVPGMKGVTPLLRTTNPKGAKPKGESDDVVAWAYDRKDGGRSFAFTGAHLHISFLEEGYRRLLTNGILWTAKIDTPATGAPVELNKERLDGLQTPAPAKAKKADKTTATSLELICPSKDSSHFVGKASGKKFVVWGVNYDHDDAGRLLEDYWDKEWATVVEDFKEIKAIQANVVRIHLQLGKFMDAADRPNEANLARLGKLVRLAEETGLYLDVTGLGCYHKKDVPAWYDVLGESKRWEVQERFWKAVAGVCKESAAIFCYDLMNEPVMAGDKKDNEWLVGEFGGKHFVQRITRDMAGRTREEVAKQWVKQLTAAIRSVDDRHMITVGVIPWAHVFKGAKPLFYAPGVGDPLDFVSVHFYPKKGDVAGSLAALKVYEIGKPLVVEEIFPLGCSIEEAGEFIERSREFCDGWVSFYWGKTIEENDKAGDIKGALMGQWLRYFRSKAPEMSAIRKG